ncbi:MAG: hypothetical protein WCC22_01020 [Terriglobales bacterium]
MSELESLVSHASTLNSKVDFWNSAVLWALLLTALAAGAIVFSQRLAFVRAKQLADVQDKIAKIKEDNARQRADSLDQANVKVRTDLQTETGKVAGLEKAASDAKAAQQRVETDLAKQREKTANAEKSLLELQARLADRTLSAQQRSALIDQLKPWAGVDVDVLIWGDTAEIEIISGQILESLKNAGWSLHTGHAGGGGAVRGILVGTRADADSGTALAANTLISGLQSAGLAAGPWKFNEMAQPPIMFNSSFTGKAAIRLFIGSKPPN